MPFLNAQDLNFQECDWRFICNGYKLGVIGRSEVLAYAEHFLSTGDDPNVVDLLLLKDSANYDIDLDEILKKICLVQGLESEAVDRWVRLFLSKTLANWDTDPNSPDLVARSIYELDYPPEMADVSKMFIGMRSKTLTNEGRDRLKSVLSDFLEGREIPDPVSREILP